MSTTRRKASSSDGGLSVVTQKERSKTSSPPIPTYGFNPRRRSDAVLRGHGCVKTHKNLTYGSQYASLRTSISVFVEVLLFIIIIIIVILFPHYPTESETTGPVGRFLPS